MSETVATNKLINWIMVGLLFGGFGLAAVVYGQTTAILTTQNQIVEIQKQQVEILRQLSNNLTLAMDRQITVEKLESKLKDHDRK